MKKGSLFDAFILYTCCDQTNFFQPAYRWIMNYRTASKWAYVNHPQNNCVSKSWNLLMSKRTPNEDRLWDFDSFIPSSPVIAVMMYVCAINIFNPMYVNKSLTQNKLSLVRATRWSMFSRFPSYGYRHSISSSEEIVLSCGSRESF